MPTTYLADLVAKVRIDLHDEDSSDYRWTDAHLQRYIARALREYSAACPLQATTTLSAVEGVRAYSLAALSAITGRPDAISAVECPYDAAAPEYPAKLVHWRVHNDTLYLLEDETPASGDVIRISYTTEHTLSDSTRTYPPDDEDLLALGTAAYAALEREAYAAERITVGEQTAQHYAGWGERMLARFEAELARRRQAQGQRMDARVRLAISD
jgi:hypothetical protein